MTLKKNIKMAFGCKLEIEYAECELNYINLPNPMGF